MPRVVHCRLWSHLLASAPHLQSLPELVYSLLPHVPVAGRLTRFLPFWRQVTSDPWVLSVVEHGYRLEFTSSPPGSTGVRNTRLCGRDGESALLDEVEGLCAKCAVKSVPPGQRGDGYYSTYFLVTKKDGGMRPILNLKQFNKHLVHRRFKMETLNRLISIVVPGVWMASLDLKDAYLHVPIAREHWKYLRFAVQGRHLQFIVTPFGLSQAPMLFTRVVRALIMWLRMRGVRLHAYLDDILILGDSPQQVQQSLQMTIQVFTQAGFIINVKKSDLVPTQGLTYIGGHFDTRLGRVFLPVDRKHALVAAFRSFARVGAYHPARLWLQVLGLMAATISSVALARLRMRPIQWYLKSQWQDRVMTQQILVTRQVFMCLQWWMVLDNLSQGRPFQEPPHTVTVTTDSSMLGWGGHAKLQGETRLVADNWSSEETRTQHINVLELRAVRLTLCRLQQWLQDRVVLVECDNTTAVSYLNKMGGTKSHMLCQEAMLLHEWALQHGVTVRAVHRPGVDNALADFLSRNRPDPTEWSLSSRACSKLFRHWGTPQVDLFASQQNHKLPVWFSRHSCLEATAVDAFQQNWQGLKVYAFPPTNLILKTLQQIRDQQVEDAIVVVPHWPAREWFSLLLQMASTTPVRFRLEIDLLSQHLLDKGKLYHPDLSSLSLTAWRLNGKSGVIRASPRLPSTLHWQPSKPRHEQSTTQGGEATSSGALRGALIHFELL